MFLVLPAAFFLGLGLIPLGVYLGKRPHSTRFWRRSRRAEGGAAKIGTLLRCHDFSERAIGTQLTYRAVKHMATPQLCGQSCHSMKPEFSAYLNSPHSEVDCGVPHFTRNPENHGLSGADFKASEAIV